jgi:hypothetical protein
MAGDIADTELGDEVRGFFREGDDPRYQHQGYNGKHKTHCNDQGLIYQFTGPFLVSFHQTTLLLLLCRGIK